MNTPNLNTPGLPDILLDGYTLPYILTAPKPFLGTLVGLLTFIILFNLIVTWHLSYGMMYKGFNKMQCSFPLLLSAGAIAISLYLLIFIIWGSMYFEYPKQELSFATSKRAIAEYMAYRSYIMIFTMTLMPILLILAIYIFKYMGSASAALPALSFVCSAIVVFFSWLPESKIPERMYDNGL